MKKRVKITTLDWILDIIFPCYCKGCGKIGFSLCLCCIFDNLKKNRPFYTNSDPYFRNIFVCGMRTGLLSGIILEYKFLSRRRYSYALSEMLYYTILKYSKEKYVIVPLPTIPKHIRSRGFDHIMRLACELSAISGFSVCPALARDKTTVQVGSSAERRLKQAKEAYKINPKVTLDLESHYLLLDDVWTTGASMRAARDVLEAELIRRGASKNGIKISAIVLAKNSGYNFD